MTYSDAIASIEQNSWFKTRVREATSIYANYLLNTPVEDEMYDAKINLGSRLSSSADMTVNTLMFTLSGDQEVLTAGPAIPEAQLQQIVEKTINKYFPVTPAPAAAMFQPMTYLPTRPRPQ
jgi:hypothetical protein